MEVYYTQSFIYNRCHKFVSNHKQEFLPLSEIQMKLTHDFLADGFEERPSSRIVLQIRQQLTEFARVKKLFVVRVHLW